MLRLFISSVQKEFAAERAALRDYLHADPLLRRFFQPFLFEDLPAADSRADAVYLDEVARCDVFLGLFGEVYGTENAAGLSATQREFDHATQHHKHRLIFVRGADDTSKHPKMQALIRQAGGELIWKRFVTPAELIAGVYAALVRYLEERALIRHGPFDAAPCPGATPPTSIPSAWRGFCAKPAAPAVFRCPSKPRRRNCSPTSTSATPTS